MPERNSIREFVKGMVEGFNEGAEATIAVIVDDRTLLVSDDAGELFRVTIEHVKVVPVGADAEAKKK